MQMVVLGPADAHTLFAGYADVVLVVLIMPILVDADFEGEGEDIQLDDVDAVLVLFDDAVEVFLMDILGVDWELTAALTPVGAVDEDRLVKLLRMVELTVVCRPTHEDTPDCACTHVWSDTHTVRVPCAAQPTHRVREISAPASITPCTSVQHTAIHLTFLGGKSSGDDNSACRIRRRPNAAVRLNSGALRAGYAEDSGSCNQSGPSGYQCSA